MNAFFLSISSDIASEMASHLLAKGWNVAGTSRSPSLLPDYLNKQPIFEYDIAQSHVNLGLIQSYLSVNPWDLVVLSPSAFGPVQPFISTSWVEWKTNLDLNFSYIVQFLHSILSCRRRDSQARIWLWGGPGTNSAPKDVSSLCIAKICQIKFAEILDAENDDIIAFSVGPGWVATKTHEQIMQRGPKAGPKYYETKAVLESGKVTPMRDILEFLDWTLSAPKSVLGGRNFSIRSDRWRHDCHSDPFSFSRFLEDDIDAYKLRRFRNDWSPDCHTTSFAPS
jgi:NADP-dependent 3-hydroxy acid dehydrogenase YdfG